MDYQQVAIEDVSPRRRIRCTEWRTEGPIDLEILNRPAIITSRWFELHEERWLEPWWDASLDSQWHSER